MDNYKTDDYVIIENNKSHVVGQIESFITKGGQKCITYKEFFSPEKTILGKQEHNSKYEVFYTNEVNTAPISNIISKCQIYNFEEFCKLVVALKEKKPNKAYFARQGFSTKDGKYTPNELQKFCYCNKPFNPDKSFIICRKCSNYVHLECFYMGEAHKCPNKTCNNNIHDQISNSSKKIAEPDQSLIGLKRNREEIIELEQSNESKSSKNIINLEANNKDEDKNNDYRNLDEEGKKNLLFLIDKSGKRNNAIYRSGSVEEKGRNTTRQYISECLVTKNIYFSFMDSKRLTKKKCGQN